VPTCRWRAAEGVEAAFALAQPVSIRLALRWVSVRTSRVKPRRMDEPGAPDTALDPYRRAVAKAYENGVEVGYLWTRVRVWWLVVGHRWWQRAICPAERPEWLLEFHSAAEWTGLPSTDRVATDRAETAEMIDQFDRNLVEVDGHTYTLVWLRGAEAEAVPAPGDYWAAEIARTYRLRSPGVARFGQDGRRWYALDVPVLDRDRAILACAAVLDLLRPVLASVDVDAYSDFRDSLPAEVEAAQGLLRGRAKPRSRWGWWGEDSWMALPVDPQDEEQWGALRTYAAWSIHVALYGTNSGEDLGCLHDCGSSISAALTDQEAADLAAALSAVGPLILDDGRHKGGG